MTAISGRESGFCYAFLNRCGLVGYKTMTEPMRPEVQEVVDFALKGAFLFGSEPPEGLDLKVVSNWPKDLLDAGPDGKDYGDLKDGEATFGGIRAVEGGKVYGVLSRNIEMNKQSRRLERLLTGRKGVYEQRN